MCSTVYTALQKRRLFQFKHLNALASGQGAGLYSNRAEQNSKNPLPDNTHGNFIFRRKCDIFNTFWILHRHTLVDRVKTKTLQRQKEKLSHEWKSNYSKREQKCWPMIFQLCPIRVRGYRQKRDTQGHLPNNLFVTHLKGAGRTVVNTQTKYLKTLLISQQKICVEIPADRPRRHPAHHTLYPPSRL